MSEASPNFHTRLTTLELNHASLDVRVDELETDYYDDPERIGIRSKVLVLWYGTWAVIGIVGTIAGYCLRLLVE